MSVKIYILEDRCKGCRICVEVCQTETLEMSKRKNADGHQFPTVRDESLCLACGLCEMFCPDFAIWITIDREKADK